MNRSPTPHIAFTVSAMSVVVAIPASAALQASDLPGVVLVVTGTVAMLLARPHSRERVFTVLAALVLLMAVLVALHVLWHRLGVSPDWLAHPYFGAVVASCALALSLGLRLLRRAA